ncbi:hypothetical protein V2G26_008006 [Clonostachys chloroleuca]
MSRVSVSDTIVICSPPRSCNHLLFVHEFVAKHAENLPESPNPISRQYLALLGLRLVAALAGRSPVIPVPVGHLVDEQGAAWVSAASRTLPPRESVPLLALGGNAVLGRRLGSRKHVMH